MYRAGVTEAELAQALRQHGLGSFEQVGALVLEPDGRFTVVTRDQPPGDALHFRRDRA